MSDSNVTCDVVFHIGSYSSWCNTHEERANTEHQACFTGMIKRAEAAEARAAELERQLSAEQAAHKSDVEALRIELRLAYDAYHRTVHP